MNILDENVIEKFNDSFERCNSDSQFYDLFFIRFMDSSEEIRGIFANSEIGRIKKMMKDALFYKMLASGGALHAIEKLEKLAHFHKDLGIERRHHDHWLDVLMGVVEEVDPRYSAEVDHAWREVLGIGLQIMKAPLPASGHENSE